MNRFVQCGIALVSFTLSQAAFAAQPQSQAAQGGAPASCRGAGGFLPAPATFRSVEVLADGRVTFLVCAPEATQVSVTSSDMPDVIPFGRGGPVGLAMTKDASGLWSVTSEKALAPDNYRYGFVVNGVTAADPAATSFAMDRVGVLSTLDVPGEAGAFQTYDAAVPHGIVSEIEYWSASLGVKRRAHVYTPPGYFRSTRRYPVLYLVHGAGDSDDSWTSTGHAHYILDNLIASGKARPMIVVMPFGHTPERGAAGADILANSDFGDDLHKELIPHIDAQFRTLSRPASRAMAGLSMGGAHTIRFGLTQPDTFRYIGIFSMGLGVGGNQADVADYEKQHAAALARSAREMKLVYYAMGREDFLYGTVAPTRAMLDRQGIRHLYNESGGGHTWINWRRYLADLLPRLF